MSDRVAVSFVGGAFALLLATSTLATPPPTPSAPSAASPSTSPGTVYGDVDGNGTITSVDALAALSHVVGRTLPDGWSVDPQGDANCDATVTSLDALIILSHVVGKDVSQFCVATSIAASVEVTPDSTTLTLDDTATVTATVRDADGTIVAGVDIEWSSTDTSVVGVDGAGRLDPRIPGTGSVVATVGGLADTADVQILFSQESNATLVINLPAGVPDTGLVAALTDQEVSVTDLSSTPVQLNPSTIQSPVVANSAGDPMLMGIAAYPQAGETVTVDATSTAVALTMAHPLVGTAFFLDPTNDTGYLTQIEQLPEVATVAGLLERKLPTTPNILTAMDSELQTAVNAAAEAFLSGFSWPSSPSGPQGVVEVTPDFQQDKVSITETKFDSAGTSWARLDITNSGRRHVVVQLKDGVGSRFGTPSEFYVAPARSLLGFASISAARSSTLVDIGELNDGAALDDRIGIGVFGPGFSGFPDSFTNLTADEKTQVIKAFIATTITQFYVPFLATLVDLPVKCMIQLGNGMFNHTIADSQLEADVESLMDQGSYLRAMAEILVKVLASSADTSVLTSFLSNCSVASVAAGLATALAKYNVPVVGQLVAAYKVINLSVTVTPTVRDIANTSPKAFWLLSSELNADLSGGTEGLTADLQVSCTDDSGADAPCFEFIWDWGDGVVDTTVSVNGSHTYGQSGKYTVTVDVTDFDGTTARDTLTIFPAKPLDGVMAFVGRALPEDEGPDQIFLYDLNADTVRQLTSYASDDPERHSLELAMSPDGNRIFYTVTDFATYQVRMIFVPTGENVVIHRGASGDSLSSPVYYEVSEDGRKLAYFGTRRQPDGDIHDVTATVDIASGRKEILVDNDGIARGGGEVCGQLVDAPTLGQNSFVAASRWFKHPNLEDRHDSEFGICVGDRSSGAVQQFVAKDFSITTRPSWVVPVAGDRFVIGRINHGGVALLNADGTYAVQRYSSLNSSNANSTEYHAGEGLVLVAQSFDGLYITDLDETDRQTRLVGEYRVHQLAAPHYVR